jgi:hypothetical protein
MTYLQGKSYPKWLINTGQYQYLRVETGLGYIDYTVRYSHRPKVVNDWLDPFGQI